MNDMDRLVMALEAAGVRVVEQVRSGDAVQSMALEFPNGERFAIDAFGFCDGCGTSWTRSISQSARSRRRCPVGTIKQEFEALLAMPPAERRVALTLRATTHLRTGEDEDGYNLYLLWGIASTDGVKRFLERGGPKWPGRPRGGQVRGSRIQGSPPTDVGKDAPGPRCQRR